MFDSLLNNNSFNSSLGLGVQRVKNILDNRKEIDELWDHLEDYTKEKHDKVLN